jgi:hypothetical protein
VDTLAILLSVCLGVGLAAACGFRVFVPPLALGIAVKLGLPITDVAPEWLGSWPALIVLGIAAVVEGVAYYVPWLDHALDVVASPLAVIAGVLLTAGVTTELHPGVQWTLAVVAGGGAAAVTQTATVMTRAFSSATTGGLANWMVTSLENLAAIAFAVLTLLLAPIALVLFLASVYWLWKTLKKKRTNRQLPQFA